MAIHPDLPVPLGALSHWQRSTRDHPLLNAGRDNPLPLDADVVIIGSGLCGAVVANTLLYADDRPGKVVILEAREICSGASGRNAGHCRPDVARGFYRFADVHGRTEARKILESESEVFRRTDEFISKHEIDCEWVKRPTLDVCMTKDFMEYSADALAGLRSEGGQPSISVLDAEETAKEYRVSGAEGSFAWPAATVNPAKLCLGVHTVNMKAGGYELYAWAPVTSVEPAENGRWTVTTPRGSITAPKVIHCTNAYCRAILPELSGLVVPTIWLAQAMSLIKPPAGEEAFPKLPASYSVRFSPSHFYSVAPQPDDSIVMGSSGRNPDISPEVQKLYGNTVDDSSSFGGVASTVYDAFRARFPEGEWPNDGGIQYAWTGIIGFTPDAVPFIGDVPGKSGQYVAAGYNGHGMARIFLCAPTLAKYVLSGKWDSAMPSSFIVTEERLQRLRANLDKGALSPNGSTAARTQA